MRASPGPAKALTVAGACVLALAAIWPLAELVPPVHHGDSQLLYELTTLERPAVASVGDFLLHLLDPRLFLLWATALVATALARERPRVAFAIAGVMGLGPLSAETLKPLLGHAHDQVGHVVVGPDSWPSGHATAAGVLMVSAVLVAPAAIRVAVAAAGALFAAAVGVFLLILHWHMPSDVLGGYVLATMWGALAVAALRLAERLRPSRRLDRGRTR